MGVKFYAFLYPRSPTEHSTSIYQSKFKSRGIRSGEPPGTPGEFSSSIVLSNSVFNRRVDSTNPQDDMKTTSQHPVDVPLFSWMGSVRRDQWLVLLAAWLGWVFDSMDGTLFN